jgi:hypothetical protein
VRLQFLLQSVNQGRGSINLIASHSSVPTNTSPTRPASSICVPDGDVDEVTRRDQFVNVFSRTAPDAQEYSVGMFSPLRQRLKASVNILVRE